MLRGVDIVLHQAAWLHFRCSSRLFVRTPHTGPSCNDIQQVTHDIYKKVDKVVPAESPFKVAAIRT